MVADCADINVDAAAQVAHAISVHQVETESDYFTAVDDRTSDAEPGAGMIGTVDFNSATLYRYAALDVNLLAANLGKGLREDESAATPVRRAVEAFLDGFIASCPPGRSTPSATTPCPKPSSSRSAPAAPSATSAPSKSRSPPPAPATSAAPASSSPPTPPTSSAPTATPAPARGSCAWGRPPSPLAALGTEIHSLSQLVDTVGQTVTERLERQ